MNLTIDRDSFVSHQDHAAGSLIVEEAGGTVTDSRGIPLNFGLGRTLKENNGVVAAGKEAHSLVLDAIMKLNQEQRAKA